LGYRVATRAGGDSGRLADEEVAPSPLNRKRLAPPQAGRFRPRR